MKKLLLIAVVALFLPSCNNISTEYSVGLHEYIYGGWNLDETISAIEDYIKGKGAPWGTVIKTGYSTESNDRQMQKELDAAVKMFISNELDVLLEELGSIEFKYGAQRETDVQGETVFLESYFYYN